MKNTSYKEFFHFLRKKRDVLEYINENGQWTPLIPPVVFPPAYELPYKEYTVFLTQTGVGDPTETIVLDTIGNLSWIRGAAGEYILTSLGSFTADKTIPNKDVYTDEPGNVYTVEWIGVNTMRLITYASTDTTTPADGILDNQYFHIKVYN